MTPEDIRAALEKADLWAAENGLGLCDGLTLVVTRPRPPLGYKIKTPLGNCDIMNCQEINGEYQTVFRATRKQVLAFLKKCNLLVMTGRTTR